MAPVLRNLGEIAQGGRRRLKLADEIWDRFNRKVPSAKQPVVLQQALAEAAAMPQAEFDRKAEEIVNIELIDQPPEMRRDV